mmetsp:Transcript_17977/g.48902  ORF Transcript_17977/g.48902 Transcript_17977/m.48902 type:complete len:217 (+) Transcript_17977:785-1435(+)
MLRQVRRRAQDTAQTGDPAALLRGQGLPEPSRRDRRVLRRPAVPRHQHGLRLGRLGGVGRLQHHHRPADAGAAREASESGHGARLRWLEHGGRLLQARVRGPQVLLPVVRVGSVELLLHHLRRRGPGLARAPAGAQPRAAGGRAGLQCGEEVPAPQLTVGRRFRAAAPRAYGRLCQRPAESGGGPRGRQARCSAPLCTQPTGECTPEPRASGWCVC